MTASDFWNYILAQTKWNWWHLACVNGISWVDRLIFPRWVKEFKKWEKEWLREKRRAEIEIFVE